jgi:hypothetical protein
VLHDCYVDLNLSNVSSLYTAIYDICIVMNRFFLHEREKEQQHVAQILFLSQEQRPGGGGGGGGEGFC